MECKSCIFNDHNLINNKCTIHGEKINRYKYQECTAPIEKLNEIVNQINQEKMRRNLIRMRNNIKNGK